MVHGAQLGNFFWVWFVQTRMKLLLVVAFAGLLTLTLGCGTGGSRADGEKVFGEAPESCPAAVLLNGGGDQNAEEQADCFMAEFEAGRPVVWDVVVSTVEGDPIPIRYEFDGEVVTITSDSSFDTFGSGEVDVQVCDGVRRADRLLEGVDCKSSNGDGFRADTLPGAG